MYPKISEFHGGYVTEWYLATDPPGGPVGPKWRRRRADRHLGRLLGSGAARPGADPTKIILTRKGQASDDISFYT